MEAGEALRARPRHFRRRMCRAPCPAPGAEEEAGRVAAGPQLRAGVAGEARPCQRGCRRNSEFVPPLRLTAPSCARSVQAVFATLSVQADRLMASACLQWLLAADNSRSAGLRRGSAGLRAALVVHSDKLCDRGPGQRGGLVWLLRPRAPRPTGSQRSHGCWRRSRSSWRPCLTSTSHRFISQPDRSTATAQ